MRRLVLALVLCAACLMGQSYGAGVPMILVGAPVVAGGSAITMMVFSSAQNVNPGAATSTQYVSIWGYGLHSTVYTAIDHVETPWPIDGSFSNLRYWNEEGRADAGEDVTVTLMINGVASNLACSFEGESGGGDQGCSDTCADCTVTAGDEVAWRIVVDLGDPDATELGNMAVEFTGDNANESAVVAYGDQINADIAHHWYAGSYYEAGSGGADQKKGRVPEPFTTSAFFVEAASAVTAEHVFYLCVNDGGTSSNCDSVGTVYLSCTMASSGTTCNDTVCDAADCEITQGDEWFITRSQTGAESNIQTGFGIALTDATNQRWMSQGYTVDYSTTSTQYASMSWSADLISAPRYVYHSVTSGLQPRNLYGRMETVMDSGDSLGFDLQDDGVSAGLELSFTDADLAPEDVTGGTAIAADSVLRMAKFIDGGSPIVAKAFVWTLSWDSL